MTQNDVGNIAEKIVAMRAVTRTTGMITKRAQNELLTRLNDAQLAEVAVAIRRLEMSDLERNDCNGPRN